MKMLSYDDYQNLLSVLSDWNILHQYGEYYNDDGDIVGYWVDIKGCSFDAALEGDDLEEPEEEDCDLEMGFDPYMGCYSDDC